MKFKIKFELIKDYMPAFYESETYDTYQEAKRQIETLKKRAPRTLNHYTLSVEEVQ